MLEAGPFSRREFVATTGGAALASMTSGLPALAQTTNGKKRYAMVGTGHRGTSMWGAELLQRVAGRRESMGLLGVGPLDFGFIAHFVPCSATSAP